jgi:hypothetical protein
MMYFQYQVLESFLSRTSRYGTTLFTLSIVKSYGDVVTLTRQRKGDVFRVEEAVVKETQVLQGTLETHPPFAVMSTWQHRNFTTDYVKSVAP